MNLAGRCLCGVILEWVALDPDSHLRCVGLRWCGVCGEAAEFLKTCVPCHREQSRLHQERIRRRRSPSYVRGLAEKRRRHAANPEIARAASRDRYANDPEFRERRREYRRRQYRKEVA